MLFASPANPTGAIIPAADLEELVATARDLGIAVISDEIYHRLAYAAPDVTALSFSDDVVVINSFSKYYCMTGWRIGWMVLPETLVRAGRAHPAEPLHLAAGAVADRGDRGLLGDRRTGDR